MTQQLTRIYDLAYCIDQSLDEVHLEQSCGGSDQVQTVKLNKLHVKLLAEKMKLIEVNHTARMGQVLRTELDELVDAICEHWADLSNADYVDLSHLTQIKTIYEKVQTVSRIAGCDDGDAADDGSIVGEEGDEIGAISGQLSLLGARS